MAETALIPRPKAGELVDPEAVFGFCEQVAFGRDLSDIANDPGMPTVAQFLSLVMREPQIGMLYDKARAMSAYAQEDEALTRLKASLADTKMTQVDVRKLEAYVGQLRWSASKRNPQVFSDRSNVNVTVPIQINTSLPMGGDNLAGGTTEHPNIYELKADVVREVAEPTAEEAVIEQAEERKQRRIERLGPKKGPKKRVLIPRDSAEYQAKKAAREKVLQRRASLKKARDAREAATKAALGVVSPSGVVTFDLPTEGNATTHITEAPSGSPAQG